MVDGPAAIQRLGLGIALSAMLIIVSIILITIGGGERCQSQSRTTAITGGYETTTVTECRPLH